MITNIDLTGVVGPTAFKELQAANSVQSATIRFVDQGLIIVLKIGQNARVLGRSRGGVRYFHSVDGAASVLVQHGIYKFDAEVEGWMPRTLSRNKK